MDGRLLASARKGHKRAGQKDLINHLQGKRLTQRQAIKAKCYDCSGMGEDPDCENDECSLFNFSPYNRMCKRLSQKKGKMSVKKEIIPHDATFVDALQK